MTGHRIGDGWPSPPLHNLLLPHGPYMDERGCPPQCQFRQWAEKYRESAEKMSTTPEETSVSEPTRKASVVVVFPTIMDGTVVRWYDSVDAAEHGRERISVSRNGVMVTGYLHEVPESVLNTAQVMHREWQRSRDAWPDVHKIATHRHKGLFGPIVPVEKAATT